jgi:hypothetical protein
MSLLRACQLRVTSPAHPGLRLALARGLVTQPPPSEVVKNEKETATSSEIVAPPERDVLVADVISGAPGKSSSARARKSRSLTVWFYTRPAPASCSAHISADTEYYAEWGRESGALAD